MSDKHMTLYHYWRSSCSWRVRWGFAHKNQTLSYQAIDLLKNEQQSPDYLKKNPSGLVPSLNINQSYVGESLAILEWLEERHPSPPLLPQDSFARLQVRQLCYTIMSGIQPLQNLSAQKKHAPDKEKQHAYARFWIEKGFRTYDTLLKEPVHGFSFGPTLTLADLCLIPQVYNALRFNIAMETFPKIKTIYDHCQTIESCTTTAPENYCK